MRRHALIALILLPALALGGCGGDAKKTGSTAAGDTDKMREYAKCMRANGVDMPDPSEDGRVEIRVTGGKLGDDKRKAAEQKCRHLLPNGGKPRKPKPEEIAKMRAMAKCMRENGVPDFPDPDPTSGGIQMKREKDGGGVDPESATFKKAEKTCNKGGPPRGRVDQKNGDDGGSGLSGGSGE